MSKHTFHNEFTAIIERDAKWYIGYCPEMTGANGQGETLEECRKNLAEAIALILQDRRSGDDLRWLGEQFVPLQHRHDTIGKQTHVKFGFVVRQAAIAELAHQVIEAGVLA